MANIVYLGALVVGIIRQISFFVAAIQQSFDAVNAIIVRINRSFELIVRQSAKNNQ